MVTNSYLFKKKSYDLRCNYAITVTDVSTAKAHTLWTHSESPRTPLSVRSFFVPFYSHVYIRLPSSFPICSLSCLLFPLLSLLSVLPFLLYLLLFNPSPSVCFFSFHVSFKFNCTLPFSLLVFFLGDVFPITCLLFPSLCLSFRPFSFIRI